MHPLKVTIGCPLDVRCALVDLRIAAQQHYLLVLSVTNGTELKTPFRPLKRNGTFAPFQKKFNNGMGTDIRSLDIKITEWNGWPVLCGFLRTELERRSVPWD